MRGSLIACLVALAWCARSTAAQAVTCGPQVIDTLAWVSDHAPVLRFGDTETDFPTMPFHTAFDGKDNNDDGRFDFDDPDEVAPLTPSGRLSWATLYGDYRGRDVDLQLWRTRVFRPPLHVVFYQVSELEPAPIRRYWSYLKNDPQAWHRTEADTVYRAWQRPGTCRRMAVLEYYFYYLNDRGVTGHPQDVEFVFVFVPLSEAAPRFQLLVGAGHGDRIPNNVYFEFSSELSSNQVLVETGGHASAPDRQPVGRFDPGSDVNWQVGAAWGVRDILSSDGSGLFGRYRLEMTLPRTLDRTLKSVSSWGLSYSLVALSRLARLDEAIKGGAANDIGEALDSIAVRLPRPPPISELVLPHATAADTADFDRLSGLLTPVVLPTAGLSYEVLERMRLWDSHMHSASDKEIKKKRQRIWEHEIANGDPTDILTPHLFRPTVNSIEDFGDVLDLWTWSTTWVPAETYAVSGGVVLPVFQSLGVRVDGYLTVEAGWQWLHDLDQGSFVAALTYEADYADTFSWYASTRWSSKTWLQTPTEPSSASIGLSGGLSLLAWRARDRSWVKPLRALRLHAGVRADVTSFDSLLRRTGFELAWYFR